MTDLLVETEVDKKEDEPMHHSPTDDEEEIDDASKASKESSLGSDNPKLKHRKTDHTHNKKELPNGTVITSVHVR